MRMLKKPIYTHTYRRTIAFRSAGRPVGGVLAGTDYGDDDSYNNFLIKAIGLYLHKCCKLQMDEANLKLTTIGT